MTNNGPNPIAWSRWEGKFRVDSYTFSSPPKKIKGEWQIDHVWAGSEKEARRIIGDKWQNTQAYPMFQYVKETHRADLTKIEEIAEREK